MKIRVNNIAISGPAQFFLYHLVQSYCSTFRLKTENEDEWLAYYHNKGRILFCGYHQQFFSAIRHFRTYRQYRPALMISRSRDGEIVAKLAKRCGWNPIRGSSSRGGSHALKAMIEYLKLNRLAGHIIDGPRGPAQKVKPGAVRLAHAADAAVVPVYIAAKRAWYFNSWDKFMVPKPFTKVIIRFGQLIKLNTTDDKKEFENQCQSLENTMKQELLDLRSRLRFD